MRAFALKGRDEAPAQFFPSYSSASVNDQDGSSRNRGGRFDYPLCLVLRSVDMTDISLKELADLLVLNERTVQKSVEDGVMVRSAPGKYILEKSIQNYVVHLREIAAGKANLPSESARLKASQAEYYDLKNARTRGELVSADEVEAAVRSSYRITSQKILQIPSKVAPRAAALKTPVEVEDLLHREFTKALTELSDGAAARLRKKSIGTG